MKRLLAIALAAAPAALLLPSPASAQIYAPVAGLTCTGGASPLTVPVFSFYTVFGAGAALTEAFAFLVADSSAYPEFLGALASSTTYSACTLANGNQSITFNGLQVQAASFTAYGPGLLSSYYPVATGPIAGTFAEVCFSSFTVNGVTYPAGFSCSPAAASPLPALSGVHSLFAQPQLAFHQGGK